MHAVSVDDNGEERNFLATIFEVDAEYLTAETCGMRRVFPRLMVIDVLSVETMTSLVFRDQAGGAHGSIGAR